MLVGKEPAWTAYASNLATTRSKLGQLPLSAFPCTKSFKAVISCHAVQQASCGTRCYGPASILIQQTSMSQPYLHPDTAECQWTFEAAVLQLGHEQWHSMLHASGWTHSKMSVPKKCRKAVSFWSWSEATSTYHIICLGLPRWHHNTQAPIHQCWPRATS